MAVALVWLVLWAQIHNAHPTFLHISRWVCSAWHTLLLLFNFSFIVLLSSSLFSSFLVLSNPSFILFYFILSSLSLPLLLFSPPPFPLRFSSNHSRGGAGLSPTGACGRRLLRREAACWREKTAAPRRRFAEPL